MDMPSDTGSSGEGRGEFAQQPVTVPAPGEAAPPPRDDRRLRWVTRSIAAAIFVFFLLIAWLAVTAPLSKSLQPIAPPQLTLLAADGTPIARNGANVAAPVKAAQLPDYVKFAFISIEDRRFYSHWGVDPRGIARATLSNLLGHSTQGGSTITQQLAKFTFLSPEQNLSRKAREVLIAFWLEAWLTKDQILERYLSNAYFGDDCYGLRAASLHYFHRQPEKLSLGQAAMLAGLVKAPSKLAPTHNYAGAEQRMRTVLGAMVSAGHLKEGAARAVRDPRLDVRTMRELPTGTYFADWALPQARKLSEGGYAQETMTTTLDSRLQRAAQRAIANTPRNLSQIALVAMRPNGEVVAMVGGKDYAKSPFNRVTQARRQPGSTFKLFVYLAALRDGWTPGDRIDNTAITTGAYRPKNDDGRYSPTITLEDAFAHSSNVATVRLFGKVSDAKVIRMARDLGLTSPLPKGDPSLALGTSTMTLMELTAAYAGVAGNEFPVQPTAFPAQKASMFNWIWGGARRLSGTEKSEIEELLGAVVDRGTGRAARLRTPAFGKTGTSQDHRDALFVGYAGGLVTGVWIGNDDNSPLAGTYGGGLPAQVWRNFMREALHEAPAPRPAAPAPSPDPEGPVQPLDLPDLGAAPAPSGNPDEHDGGRLYPAQSGAGAAPMVRAPANGAPPAGQPGGNGPAAPPAILRGPEPAIRPQQAP